MPNNRPACLIIPPLVAGGEAVILWEEVPGAIGYQLECSYGHNYGEGPVGAMWLNLDELYRTWAEIGSTYTWREFEALPECGSCWDHYDANGLDWGAVDADPRRWMDYAAAPSNHLIYQGPGEALKGVDTGWTWADIHRAGPSWEQITAADFSWAMLNLALPTPLSWRRIHGHHLTWDGFEDKQLTWAEFDLAGASCGQYLGCALEIPHGQPSAYFRLRALYPDATVSAWLAVGRREIATVDTLTLCLDETGRGQLQIDGERVRRLQGAKIAVFYDQHALAPLAAALEGTKSARPKITDRQPGVLRFECERECADRQRLDAPLARLHFGGPAGASSPVRLEWTCADGLQIS